MSLMSYTYESPTLKEELTLVLTMPEKEDGEHLPFAAAVLLPDLAMESSFFLRSEPLERYGRGLPPVATVSLPGCVARRPLPVLQEFLLYELPSVLRQFPLEVRALYAQGRSAACLGGLAEILLEEYSVLRLNGGNESLEVFFRELRKEL